MQSYSLLKYSLLRINHNVCSCYVNSENRETSLSNVKEKETQSTRRFNSQKMNAIVRNTKGLHIPLNLSRSQVEHMSICI